MFRTTGYLPASGDGRSHLLALLRRVPTLLLLASLLTVTLTACGGNGEESGPAETATSSPAAVSNTPAPQLNTPAPTANETVPADDSGVSVPTEAAPTPEAPMEQGAESGTQEYAEALAEAFSSIDDEVEDAAGELFGGARAFFSGEELERISSLENADSWSEQDAALMSEYAEAALEIVADFYDFVWRSVKGIFDTFTGLRPPAHLSDLHDKFVESFGESSLRFAQIGQEHVDTVRDADTNIRNREDLARFQAFINSLESGPIPDPEVVQHVVDAGEEFNEACLELKDQLEAELERDVSICE